MSNDEKIIQLLLQLNAGVDAVGKLIAEQSRRLPVLNMHNADYSSLKEASLKELKDKFL